MLPMGLTNRNHLTIFWLHCLQFWLKWRHVHIYTSLLSIGYTVLTTTNERVRPQYFHLSWLSPDQDRLIFSNCRIIIVIKVGWKAVEYSGVPRLVSYVVCSINYQSGHIGSKLWIVKRILKKQNKTINKQQQIRKTKSCRTCHLSLSPVINCHLLSSSRRISDFCQIL